MKWRLLFRQRNKRRKKYRSREEELRTKSSSSSSHESIVHWATSSSKDNSVHNIHQNTNELKLYHHSFCSISSQPPLPSSSLFISSTLRSCLHFFGRKKNLDSRPSNFSLIAVAVGVSWIVLRKSFFFSGRMFFSGDPSTRKRVALGGRSNKERDRQKLLEQTRMERDRRSWLRKQTTAAIKIQVCFSIQLAHSTSG